MIFIVFIQLRCPITQSEFSTQIKSFNCSFLCSPISLPSSIEWKYTKGSDTENRFCLLLSILTFSTGQRAGADSVCEMEGWTWEWFYSSIDRGRCWGKLRLHWFQVQYWISSFPLLSSSSPLPGLINNRMARLKELNLASRWTNDTSVCEQYTHHGRRVANLTRSRLSVSAHGTFWRGCGRPPHLRPAHTELRYPDQSDPYGNI